MEKEWGGGGTPHTKETKVGVVNFIDKKKARPSPAQNKKEVWLHRFYGKKGRRGKKKGKRKNERGRGSGRNKNYRGQRVGMSKQEVGEKS